MRLFWSIIWRRRKGKGKTIIAVPEELLLESLKFLTRRQLSTVQLTSRRLGAAIASWPLPYHDFGSLAISTPYMPYRGRSHFWPFSDYGDSCLAVRLWKRVLDSLNNYVYPPGHDSPREEGSPNIRAFWLYRSGRSENTAKNEKHIQLSLFSKAYAPKRLLELRFRKTRSWLPPILPGYVRFGHVNFCISFYEYLGQINDVESRQPYLDELHLWLKQSKAAFIGTHLNMWLGYSYAQRLMNEVFTSVEILSTQGYFNWMMDNSSSSSATAPSLQRGSGGCFSPLLSALPRYQLDLHLLQKCRCIKIGLSDKPGVTDFDVNLILQWLHSPVVGDGGESRHQARYKRNNYCFYICSSRQPIRHLMLHDVCAREGNPSRATKQLLDEIQRVFAKDNAASSSVLGQQTQEEGVYRPSRGNSDEDAKSPSPAFAVTISYLSESVWWHQLLGDVVQHGVKERLVSMSDNAGNRDRRSMIYRCRNDGMKPR